MSSFDGKSTLVLGDGRGVGVAIMHRFVAGGVSVTSTYSGSPDAAKALADEAGIQIAQTNSADHNAVINRVRESGPLDVLVVNAGIILFGDALEQDPDNMKHLFRINIHSPYYAAVKAARQVSDGGRIIIIGSIDDNRMPLAGLTSCAMSRSALQGLARGLARNFGPRGTTVNVIQPSPIGTDANPENGPLKEVMHSFMALKRHGRLEEVAGTIAWLTGPEAGFMTGAVHTTDGALGA